jgi:prephenate dehydrogenase
VRVGIIGTGLIGSSIGLACRQRGDEVLGFDLDRNILRIAVNNGAIDDTATRSEMYASCDAVVIALPLDVTIEEIRELRERTFRPEQFVIDVASVKGPIEEAGREIEAFVPTHPMAGSEKTGPSGAHADLFERRWWCYVSTRDETRTQAVRAFIDRLGAYPCAVDAREHDRIVAMTSHLPQLVAYAFHQCIRDLGESVDARMVSALCGPVAQELLRIAQSPHGMWDPIFVANASAVEDALARLQRAIDDRRISG